MFPSKGRGHRALQRQAGLGDEKCVQRSHQSKMQSGPGEEAALSWLQMLSFASLGFTWSSSPLQDAQWEGRDSDRPPRDPTCHGCVPQIHVLGA
jgi:hypothetical protein